MNSTHDKIQNLLNLIVSKGELSQYAFGGNCFNMAVALNRLYPESSIVVSYNEAIYEVKNQYIGHAAIEIDGHIIDGDGLIDKDSFLSWGMLADDDYSYIQNTSISVNDWRTLAYESKKKVVPAEDLQEYIDESIISIIMEILNPVKPTKKSKKIK